MTNNPSAIIMQIQNSTPNRRLEGRGEIKMCIKFAFHLATYKLKLKGRLN